MGADLSWLALEAKKVHDIFAGYFYLLITVLMLLGIAVEHFKWPIGGVPNFGTLVGRALIAALLLHSYPDISNTIAEVADAISSQLGDLNNFKTILDRMGDKLGELSWSWSSFKETIILIISFLSFFLLYFSIHIADSFYIYVWVLLYVFSPLLIALFVLPVTASATSALFRSLIEVAAWKVVWSTLATLLWSNALSRINQEGSQISFLSAIGYNVILAGSLLLTPFVVHALAGGGLAQMGKDLSSLSIGGMTLSPARAVSATRQMMNRPMLSKRMSPLTPRKNNLSKSPSSSNNRKINA